MILLDSHHYININCTSSEVCAKPNQLLFLFIKRKPMFLFSVLGQTMVPRHCLKAEPTLSVIEKCTLSPKVSFKKIVSTSFIQRNYLKMIFYSTKIYSRVEFSFTLWKFQKCFRALVKVLQIFTKQPQNKFPKT